MSNDHMLYRIAGSFARQSAMTTIGAKLVHVEPGKVVIELPHGDHVLQQNSFIHGGVIGMIADSACGYAALTMQPEDRTIVTSEYKINLLSPALGERFVAEGRVVRAGRQLAVVQGDVFAINGGTRKHIAIMLATMTIIAKTGDMVD